MSQAEDLAPTDQVKVILMDAISARVGAQYKTAAAAAADLRIGTDMMSRLRHGHHERFSIPWLIDAADRLGARITVTVD